MKLIVRKDGWAGREREEGAESAPKKMGITHLCQLWARPYKNASPFWACEELKRRGYREAKRAVDFGAPDVLS